MTDLPLFLLLMRGISSRAPRPRGDTWFWGERGKKKIGLSPSPDACRPVRFVIILSSHGHHYEGCSNPTFRTRG